MSPPASVEPIGTDEALEQAAEWFAVLQSDQVTDGERQQWVDWINARPANQAAWEQVERIDRQFRDLPARAGKQALNAAGRSRRQFLAGLAGVLAVTPMAWMASRDAKAPGIEVSTAVGEVRELALADGGKLWLNTDTRIAIDYTQTHRVVHLLRGEILVSTARDVRPFRVVTKSGDIIPIGTRFDVREEQGAVHVAVTEGRG